MKTSNLKIKTSCLFIFTIFIIALLFGGCDNNVTDPPPLPPPLTLSVYPIIDTREVNINANLYLGGSLVNQDGDKLRGYTVRLSLDPDTIGTLTPWATTEPDSNSGFKQEVVFNGSKEGVVLIRGWTELGDGTVSSEDTLHIWVRPPING
ncbi:MAG: hypothetical protein P9X24_15955 [Candidatus Hatepunaea meridiana]|nr:hypothetical protein [Candidatus Hatepunaea meridiana]